MNGYGITRNKFLSVEEMRKLLRVCRMEERRKRGRRRRRSTLFAMEADPDKVIDETFYGVLEMNPDEIDALPFFDQILTTLGDISGQRRDRCNLICHLVGMERREVRLSVIGLQRKNKTP